LADHADILAVLVLIVLLGCHGANRANLLAKFSGRMSRNIETVLPVVNTHATRIILVN
jgi:hypothetical protein